MAKSTNKFAPVSPSFLKGAVVLIIVASLVVIYYQRFWIKPVKENTRIGSLEKTLQDIRAAMNVDSVRQFNIQKVMAIINKYNNDMPSSRKYEIAEEIYYMSVKYTNLDVDLLCATITQESGNSWDPEVTSDAGAMGLMQIMPTIGMWIAHFEGITWTSAEEILFDPVYNIRIGSRHLSVLVENYGLEGGLAAFNGGEKTAAIWLANKKADGILLSETLNYKNHVLILYEEFKTFTL